MIGRGIVIPALVSLLVICMVCGSVWAETHTYVFDPCQSTVLERNWSWGYTEYWYSIEGEFQFTFDLNDPNPGTAWFDWMDANLSEEISYWEAGYQTTESLDILFHMTDLNSTVGNPNGIELVYEKNNPTFPQADVNVRVEYVGDSLHLTGTFWDEAYDGDRYDVNAVAVLKKYGGGLGDGNYPYLIYDANQMNAIGANPNDWDKDFELMADIDLSAYTGTSFNIIGSGPPPNSFAGVFDGDGHTISNFTYAGGGGLFAYVGGPNAHIKDLGLIDPNVGVGVGTVGSLICRMGTGSVSNCYVEGAKVRGGESTGGLIGSWGGPPGSPFLNCSMVNCYSTGSVSGYRIVGGLVGWHEVCTMVNCYSTASVSGSGERVGGLLGASGVMRGLPIYNCYSTGPVTGQDKVGGLVGQTGPYGEISNCYSTGNVTGNSYVGGLVGTNNVTVNTSFSTGNVTGNSYVGGLMGGNWDTVNASFWDVNSSGEPNSDGGTGLTTVEMQTESTYTSAGWDFVGELVNGPNDIWDICEGTNYPKFVWQIPWGDLACPDGVTLVDFSVLGAAWYSGPGDGNWDPNCDISEPNDNLIDERDLRVFAENYLTGLEGP
jgi:hypothetical protein